MKKNHINISQPKSSLFQEEPEAEFAIQLSELEISKESLIETFDYAPGKIPDLYLEKISEVFEKLESRADIRAGYSILQPDQFQLKKNGILCKDQKMTTGRIIARQLDKSETVALFAGTAGSGFGPWANDLFERGDFPGGYVVDFIGSELVEVALDWLEMRLQESIQTYQRRMTNRFSPGYCGWNVKEQFKLFSLLPENFCGIQLTDSALMIPIKSVSGIIGIGKNVERKNYPCEICNMKDCYRKKLVNKTSDE